MANAAMNTPKRIAHFGDNGAAYRDEKGFHRWDLWAEQGSAGTHVQIGFRFSLQSRASSVALARARKLPPTLDQPGLRARNRSRKLRRAAPYSRRQHRRMYRPAFLKHAPLAAHGRPIADRGLGQGAAVGDVRKTATDRRAATPAGLRQRRAVYRRRGDDTIMTASAYPSALGNSSINPLRNST